MGNQRIKAAILHVFGGANPPDEKEGGMPMYITYSDLIQVGIFICALVGLCFTPFKGRK